MDELDMNLTETFPFTLQMFQNISSKKITFTSNREIDYNSEPSDTIYEVYNYQQCNGLADCRFIKVGSFKDQKLQLNRSAVHSYPLDGNANPYDVASAARCPEDPICSVCVPSNLPDRVLFVKGDWYVVAVVPIYQRKDDNQFTCSKEIRDSLGNDIAESIKFAIDKINIELSSLTGKNSSVGLIVINGCESELVIKDKMFSLHKGTYKLRPGFPSSEINNRILGYVGGLSSSMSTAIAEVLTKLGYVQVSYASTSPFLSDKTLYPYFLRIPTADDQQAQVIMDIVTSLGSTIIQVLYTNGSYGEGGLSALQKLGKTKGVCIIPNEIAVTEDYTVFNGLLANLRQIPQAKLVVTFVRSHLIQPVIASVIQKMKTNEFIFIGSETWGGRESMFLERNRAKLHGSLTISLDLPPVRQFTSYLSEQNINDLSNPWHRYFWEKRGNCIFPGSFQRSGNFDNNEKTRECNLTILAQPPHDPWIPFAVAATKALVSGVKQVILSKICNSSKTTCAARNPHLLAKNMKTEVKLDLYGNGTKTRVFDDTGDGVVEYQILHITTDSSSGRTQYTQIGSWSKIQGMEFNKGYLHFPLKKYKSLCLTDYECSKCIRSKEPDEKATGSTTWMVYTLIGFGCLLLLCFLVIVILCYRIRHMIQRECEYMDVINIHSSVKNKVSNVSNKSDIYLTAKSSFGIEPYNKEEDSPPNPCLSLPEQQTITVETNKHTTRLSH
ncbi:metabotropic glutamate receptor 1 [Patella vulgata]|uniref:metabotropic glutamate receptor 1 n=1 Tax=Patella vulgata TaxID=6465 RepID=UPI0024A7F421|nr:metabotropic glutamate receptor 1 [Patella vulgata]